MDGWIGCGNPIILKLLHFRKEDTRIATPSREGISAGEKLKTRKSPFQGA